MPDGQGTPNELFPEEEWTKRCGRCKKFKPAREFGKVKGVLRCYCRPCHNAQLDNPDTRAEKFCPRCKETKALSEFNRSGKRRQSWCRPCGRVALKERYLVEKEAGRTTLAYREYYWRRRKWTYLRSKYGCDQETYERLQREQGGVCALCRRPETDQWKGVTLNLAVDHCHETKKIRGLLCRSCNLAIGKFREDAEVVQRAADYLRHHSR